MKRLIILAVVVLLSACASTTYRPIVDMKGVDYNKYEANLQECRAYAAQAAGVGTGAGVGAVLGAAVGFALSRATGSQYNHGAAARTGAVAGGVSGAGAGAINELGVLKECLRGRGYHVLN